MHETPFFRFAGSTVFPTRRYPHILCLAANEKDFSHSLEMTNAGKRYSRIVSLLHGEAAFSLLPMKGGAPKGRRLESPRYEREYEESVLSYRHPERSRGIFYVAAVLCTYEVMIKSPRCFGCSSTDALRLTGVQGRFLAALEMTIREKRYSHFVDFPIGK